jgi:hypothetical protein
MTHALRRWCVIALLLTSTSWATTTAAATAATARQTIAKLNVQRAANGIPAGLTEDPALSAACAEHDDYMALNNTLTHVEDPNNPGYTAAGASAGANAVLTRGSNWDTGNPYEYAPLHLDQLLAPRLLTLGSADAFGFSCTTTFPGWTRSDPLAMTVYTYPGNGGRVYPSEVARELPWTPGDLVGLAQPSRTGPTLFVLADAPNERPEDNPATLSDATVSGPTGPVAVRTVDGNTALPSGSQYPTLAPYISPGGFIIPVRPLIPGTAYHAHVIVTLDKLQNVYDWSFTTLASDPHSSLTAKGGRLLFSSASHQPVRVTFRRTGGGRSAPVMIRPGRNVRLTLAPGSWQVCGHQPAGSVYAGYDQCLTISVTGVPALRIGRPKLVHTTVALDVHFSPILRGHSAAETITALSQQCQGSTCVPISGTSRTRTVTLRGRLVTLGLPLPAHGHGFQVELRTDAFQSRGAQWGAAHAVVTFVRR